MNRALKIILVCFVFVVSFIVVFSGIQWFSNSIGSLLIRHSGALQSSLETSVDRVEANVAGPSVIDQNTLPLRNWEVPKVVLEAKSAISVEVGPLQTKTLFNKNETEKLPVASLTKLMSALVVFDNYNLSQQVTISETAMAAEGVQGVLKAGEVLTVADLLHVMLMESSNRAAVALSEVMGPEAFISSMNNHARALGLTSTHFQDVAGLDESSYSTTEDLAKLTEYLFDNYPFFREVISLKQYDLYLPDGTFHHTLVSTNQFLGEYNVIGGKTGFTESAQGCFMTIQETGQRGHYIINIILGAQDRFLEMKNLMDWVGAAYKFSV